MAKTFLRAAGAALLAAAAGLATLSGPAAAAEQVLKAVTGTPVNLVWNQPLKDYIAAVNERGKGIVQLELIGGPEAVPVPEQFRATPAGWSTSISARTSTSRATSRPARPSTPPTAAPWTCAPTAPGT